MILLELTEKEAEVLKQALMVDEANWENNSNCGYTVKESVLKSFESIWDKLDVASLPKKDFLITNKDFFHIMSLTKSQYHLLPSNLHISDKSIEENDLKYISFANAIIMWLNGNSILKKLVRFDYTDKSEQYEITE